MFRKNTFVLIVLCITIVGCNNGGDFDDYEGIWEGTYTGTDEGTWKMRIDDEGVAEAVGTPADGEGDQSFIFKGNLNENGELTMTATVFGRVAIYEAFLTETNLTGTWEAQDGDFSGEWSGAKRISEERFPYNLLLNP